MEWPEFQAAHLNVLGQGDIAFFGQLYPDVYPGDQQAHAALRAGTLAAMQAISPEYKDLVQGATGKGAQFDRLRVLRLPGLPDSDPEDIRTQVRILRTTPQFGENPRIAWYDEQAIRLKERNPENSWPVAAYLGGVASKIPKASFWATYAQGGAEPRLTVVAMRHYKEDGTLQPFDVYTPPTLDDALTTYVRYWRGVFLSPHQSFVPAEVHQQLALAAISSK